jgi:hypothetical protein
MSWIIGIIGKHSSLKQIIKKLHPVPLFTKENEYFYLAAGGNRSTCFFSDINPDQMWIATGVGLVCSDRNYKLMRHAEWEFYSSNDKTSELCGHFIFLKLRVEKVEIQTDKIGLRDIYLFQSNEYTIFSTRLDWIGKFSKSSFDISNLGSGWLLSSQLTNGSLLKNIVRITKCKLCSISTNSYQVINWQSQFSKKNNPVQNDFSIELNKLIVGLAADNENLELSLSGGLDSRLLLSFLLKNKINFNAHTFGNPDHPDNKIVNQISEKTGFKHRNIYTPVEKIENLERQIEEYCLIKRISSPVTEYLNLHYYDTFEPGTLIIDGGFGELWRNESLLKLKTTHKQAVKEKNIDSLFKLLSVNRADIFSYDVLNEMRIRAKNQIDELFSHVKSIEEIGINNFIDIILFDIKMLNFISPEQTRIDHYAVNLMPFVQPTLLNLFLSIEDKSKENGRMVRQIINQNCPELGKFKLVKGNVTFSFHSGSIKSRLVNRLKSQLKLSYTEPDKIIILNRLRDYAYDLLLSQSLKNFELYDYKKVTNLVENFYDGDLALSNQVSWWLSFEIFRKSISESYFIEAAN